MVLAPAEMLLSTKIRNRRLRRVTEGAQRLDQRVCPRRRDVPLGHAIPPKSLIRHNRP